MRGVVMVVVLSAALCSCWGITIDTCGDDQKVQIEETGDAVFNCTGITTDRIEWKINNTDGEESQIGTCTWSNNVCSNGTHDDYSVSRPQRDTSVLTVTGNYRTMIAGTVQCAELNHTQEEGTAACDVRVVYTSYKVSNSTLTVNKTDWTVSESRDVDKIYASDGNYSCQWHHQSPQGTLTPCTGQKTMTHSTGQQYYRMTCSFTGQPLPTEDGNHTYLLTIDPRKNPTQAHLSVIVIQSPQGPPVLHNCPSAIVEGDDVSCTCEASASEPSALVSWYSSPVSNTPTLQLNNVSQSQHYTCRQYWGGSSTGHTKETSYAVNVKYPPSSPPEISGISSYTAGDSVNLTCTVRGGQPPVTSVTFHCDHHGNDTDIRSTPVNQTSVTSTVVISSLSDQDNGTVCLCSAVWNVRPSVYTTTGTVTLTVQGSDATSTPSHGPSTTTNNSDNHDNDNDNDDDDDSSVAYIVGGVVGATVLIIITIVLVVVCIRKRRGKAERGEDRREDVEGEEEFVEHINTIYQSADDPDLDEKKPSAVALRIPAAEKNGTAPLPDTQEPDTEQETDTTYSLIPADHFGSGGHTDHQEPEGSPYSSADQPGNDPDPHVTLGPYESVGELGVNTDQDVDDGLYSYVDDGEDNPIFVLEERAQPQDDNTYAVVNRSGSQNTPDPQNGDYAVVNKSRPNKEPADEGDPGHEPAQNVYAQVNKKSKGQNPGVPRPPEGKAESYEYTKVQKPDRTDKPLHAAKPKPPVPAKPSVLVKPKHVGVRGSPSQGTALVTRGFGDGKLPNDQISITADDDYNTLAFHRSPATELSENPESDYSHIGAVGQ